MGPVPAFISMRALVVLVMLSGSCLLRAATPLVETWCGTDSGELPDLWQDAMLEVQALQEMPKAGTLEHAPGRVGVLLNKFALLQRGSVKQGRETMNAVRQSLEMLSKLRPQLIDAAHSTNVTVFTQSMAAVRLLMDELHDKYEPGSLQPGITPANKSVLLPSPPTLSVIARAPLLVPDQPAQVDLRLRDGTGAGIGSLQLVETHTRRLHAMVIDLSLEDYHHKHPITSGRPGEFMFGFTPRKSGDYLLWLDVTPEATGRNENLEAVLTGSIPSSASPSRLAQMESMTDGWNLQLSTGQKRVIANEPVNARVRVTDERGKPCFILEPVMGAFAHVIGIMDDRRTMIHVHSRGEPPGELSRSGPEVPFRFVAPNRGFLKLFVQIQINGGILVGRFGVSVE